MLPASHSETAVVPGWKPGLLGSSVCSPVPPEPHHNCLCLHQGTFVKSKCGLGAPGSPAPTPPPPQELAGQKCSLKPQGLVPWAAPSVLNLAQARPPPGVRDRPTSVHAQEAVCPGSFHQAVYPRSRRQKRKSVGSKRLSSNEVMGPSIWMMKSL